MRRRALLTTLGTAIVGLAGCQTGQPATEATPVETTPSATPAEGATSGPSERPTETPEEFPPDSDETPATLPDPPGPDAESRFAGTSVPPLEDTAWYHDADESTQTYVRPETERAELPASVEFTFYNHSSESLGCGHWNVYKLHDREWFFLGPWVHTADCRMVESGGTVSWTVDASHDALPDDETMFTETGAIGHLGGGRYGILVGYGHTSDNSGALVSFDADPISVEPTTGLTTERDGSTVVVTSPRWETATTEERATLTVRQGGSAKQRVIPEQVMQSYYRGLRNTLPFFEMGVETVTLRTDERTARRVPKNHDRDPSTTANVRFDDRAYELESTTA